LRYQVKITPAMIKRVLLTALVLATIIGCTSAQLRTGIKLGVSTLQVDADDLTILDSMGVPEYQLGILKTKLGLHIGFFVQANIGKVFFIQPELLFNSQTVKYIFTSIEDPSQEFIKDENYQTLDFPMLLGFRFGPVRLGAGPVGHLLMNSTTEIDDPVADDEDFLNEGYTTSFQNLTWGWQAGIGIDIWQLHLDARYEANFEEFGTHMTYYGKQYSFGVKPWRFVASIGLSF
jgi:outer membrane protein with beta-barrel domain